MPSHTDSQRQAPLRPCKDSECICPVPLTIFKLRLQPFKNSSGFVEGPQHQLCTLCVQDVFCPYRGPWLWHTVELVGSSIEKKQVQKSSLTLLLREHLLLSSFLKDMSLLISIRSKHYGLQWSFPVATAGSICSCAYHLGHWFSLWPGIREFSLLPVKLCITF